MNDIIIEMFNTIFFNVIAVCFFIIIISLFATLVMSFINDI